MLAVLQFPIADARGFVPDRGARLDCPPWPKSSTPPTINFVRYFGRSVDGRLDSSIDRIDERDYCRADRALRLPKLHERSIGTDGWAVWPRGAFRRVMADGVAVARVEIGLRSHAPLKAVNGDRLRTMAERILDLPSVVAGTQGRLESHGPRLADLYARGSSRLKESTEQTRSVVRAGAPLLLVELGTDERGEWPSDAKFIVKGEVGGCDAALVVLRDHVPIWFVARGDALDPDTFRRLRRRILRLYAEETVLDEILRQFASGKLPFDLDSPLAAQFESYLDHSTGEISAERWGGLNQTAIVELFDALVGKVALAGLSIELQRIRDDLAIRVKNYALGKGAAQVTINNASGQGSFISTGYIGQVLQQFNNSTDDPHLKDAVNALHEQVNELVKRLTPEEAAAVEADLASLTKEATADKPNPTVVKSTAENLKKAAENIKAIAEPIAATVGIILKILLHVP